MLKILSLPCVQTNARASPTVRFSFSLFSLILFHFGYISCCQCSSLWLWCPLLCFRLLSWHTCWICGHGLALLSVNVWKYGCFHTYSLFWSESVDQFVNFWLFPVILFVSTQRKIQTTHEPKRFTTNQETKWECSVCLIRQMCLGREQQK